MKIYLSKVLLDAIKKLGESFFSKLYGRFCAKDSVIQVASLEPKLGDIPLEPVAMWWGGLRPDSASMSNSPATAMIYLEDMIVKAAYGEAAAQVCLYDPAEYHSRHRSLAISAKTAGKKALLVGLGSIGQKAAKEFAKHGIAVCLVDLDTVEIANPYRLNLGQPIEFLVGLPKPLATAEDIVRSIPGTTVQAHTMDVEAAAKAFDDLVESWKPEVIFLSVDTRGGTRQVNTTARHYGIPVFQVVLSDGAETGQIRFMDSTRESACLLCMDSWAQSSDVVDSRRQYAEENSQSQKAVPALSIDTSIIAYVACKLVMAYLAGEDLGRYFSVTGDSGRCQGDIMWISTTPETWITEDFLQKVVAKVEKSPSCPGCSMPDMEAVFQKRKNRKEQK